MLRSEESYKRFKDGRAYPRFSVVKTENQIGEEHLKQRWQEQVEIFYPGLLIEHPVFVVTDEFRQRWPEHYTKFRKSLSWLMRFRLWRQQRADSRYALASPDPALDHDFNTAISKAFARRDYDFDIGADIRNAIETSRKGKDS